MPSWLYVPGEGPRKDCRGRLLARTFYREGGESSGGGRGGRGGVYNEAYMPPTQISRWVSPACSVGITSASICCGLVFVMRV